MGLDASGERISSGEHRSGGALPGILDRARVGLRPASSLDVSFGPIVLAMVPFPENIVVPSIVCENSSLAWAQILLTTYWNSARYMNYARVMLNLMWDEDESTQEELWNDTLTMDPNDTARPSRWFGSYTKWRLERLRNRLTACYEKRFQGAAQVVAIYCNDKYRHGVCAGCELGGGAYHGVMYHVCFCEQQRADDELYMIHEFFHHIPPGFVDSHICGSNAVPEPWRWDAVRYDATYLDDFDEFGQFGGIYDGNNDRDKWDGAVADLLSGCPEQALRSPDSYAHWINYIGRLVDRGASWPAETTLRSHSGGGGGGGGPIDCSPNSLDGMCILAPQEDEGF